MVAVPPASWTRSMASRAGSRRRSTQRAAPVDPEGSASLEEAIEGVLDADGVTAVDQRAGEVRASEVLAAARRQHALHRHGGEALILGEDDHPLHALAALRQHVGGEPLQRRRAGIDEVPEHVHLAAVQLAGQLDAGDEPHSGRL